MHFNIKNYALKYIYNDENEYINKILSYFPTVIENHAELKKFQNHLRLIIINLIKYYFLNLYFLEFLEFN